MRMRPPRYLRARSAPEMRLTCACMSDAAAAAAAGEVQPPVVDRGQRQRGLQGICVRARQTVEVEPAAELTQQRRPALVATARLRLEGRAQRRQGLAWMHVAGRACASWTDLAASCPNNLLLTRYTYRSQTPAKRACRRRESMMPEHQWMIGIHLLTSMDYSDTPPSPCRMPQNSI